MVGTVEGGAKIDPRHSVTNPKSEHCSLWLRMHLLTQCSAGSRSPDPPRLCALVFGFVPQDSFPSFTCSPHYELFRSM